MNYTKHQIIRTKILNRQENTQPSGFLYELLFERGTLNLAPGSQVKQYNSEHWYYVASAPRDPWVRVIIDNSRVPMDYWDKNIKIGETNCLYPELIEDKDPAFYVSGESIAIPLSYISTFPDRKPEIVYPGDRISLEFLTARSRLKETADANKQYYCRDGEKRYGSIF